MNNLVWHQGTITAGHGVASGRSLNTPYPRGTIAMQRPHFARCGIDLTDCWSGTINLSFAPLEIRLHDPDHCLQHLHWTSCHPPETFSFWRVQIRLEGRQPLHGWIYQPDPATKERHWQPPTMVELLAPRVEGLSPGQPLQLADRQQRIQIIDVVRLRSRLLENLKFRVLASQDQFFDDQSISDRREWLMQVQPEALALTDAVLEQVWQQARQLYTES